jgi:hypothetical protein
MNEQEPEENEPKAEVVDVPKKKKSLFGNNYVLLAISAIIFIALLYFMFRKGYIVGARIVCRNMQMVLTPKFACAPLP